MTPVLTLLFGRSAVFARVLAAALLSSGAAVRAQTVFTWSSGDILTGVISPAGLTTINVGDTLNIVTGADHDFGSRTVVNNGTVNWTDGRVRGGGSLTNNATWNDTASSTINADFGAYAFVNSSGASYLKTTGTTNFNVGFNNSGTLLVSGGTLNLAAGGTFTSGSSVGRTGAGVVQLTAGTLTLTGTITTTEFSFNGGTVAGTHSINGILNWLAGNMNAAGVTTILAGSTFTISTGVDHDFAARSIVNQGTINWQAGRLRSGSGGNITNQAVWNDTASGFAINNDYGGVGGTTFINAATGTYNKLSGVTTFNVPLVNYGTVVASGGSLNLDAGGTLHDGSTIGSSGSGVAQLTGGVLSAGGNVGFTANNFRLTAGQLSGNMTFLGVTDWVASNFNTPGTATVGSGATLVVSGSADHDFAGHALVNNGTVNWNEGRLRSGSGGTITNNAQWNDAVASSAVNNDYGGVGGTTFINAVTGNYSKTTGTTTMNVPFVNRGAVLVSGGTLTLAAGGTFHDGSTIGSSGPGVVQLTGGTLTAGGLAGFTSSGFKLAGGQVSGDMTFLGTTEWTGADFNTTGTATIGTGATFVVTGAADHDFRGHAIVNQGVVNWNGGRLRSGSGGTITNNAQWNDSVASSAVNNDYGGVGGTTFINAVTGNYSKTAGTTTMNVPFVNRGSVIVTDGVLNLAADATFHDGSSIGSTGNGVVQFTGGVLTGVGSAGFTANRFKLTGGQVSGNLTFLGATEWTGGDFNTPGTATIGSGATFAIQGSADHDFVGHAIVNNGTVNWSGGRLRSGSGGSITNYAVWNDTGSGLAINNDFGGVGGTTFINAAGGAYRKSGGTTSILVPMVNSGLLDLQSGTIALSSTFSNGGTVALGSGATLSSTQPLTFESGSAVRGEGIVSAPTITVSGDVNPGTTPNTGLLTFNGTTSFLAGATVTFDLGGQTKGTQYDHLDVNGTILAGGNLAVRFTGGFQAAVNGNMTFALISSTAIAGSFLNVPNGGFLATADGLGTFKVNYGPGSVFAANEVVLSNFVAVPEPSTWALLITGLGVAAYSRFRRRF
ncbi:MAG: PEP-CTERM sorting domain-containing protein [Opitutaceae bacterium]|nr:PEP-CTERM sorting domain-containing protein [Opitutaceae bacterium]